MANPTVRVLAEEDWALVRQIRLESLQQHPDLFCPSRDEFAFMGEDWRARLRDTHGATFGLFVDDEICGISTIMREGNQPDARRAELAGSYIRQDYRGQGLSRLFYEARIGWAKSQGDIDTLIVEAQEDNHASHGAHRHFGFAFVHKELRAQLDGSALATLVYALELE